MILGIYGTGGAGREIYEIASALVGDPALPPEAVFIDDFKDGETLFGAKVLSFDSFTAAYAPSEASVVIGVGEPSLRKALWTKVVTAGYSMQTLIHPKAVVSPRVYMGEGVIIRYGAFVSCNCTIGNNVDIQVNAYIGHDTTIADHSEICSLVTIGGNCSLAEEVFVGQGSAIREGVTVGSKSIIGQGSNVVESFPKESVVFGNPAKLVRLNTSGKVFY